MIEFEKEIEDTIVNTALNCVADPSFEINNLGNEQIAEVIKSARDAIINCLDHTNKDDFKRVALSFSEFITKTLLQKKSAEQLANYSALTGLPNQRFGKEFILKLIQANFQFVWTFFDVDRLKPLNAALGEHIADMLLRLLAGVAQENIRRFETDGRNDLLIHRSGDEFWVIWNKTDLQGGMMASEKLRKIIEAYDFTLNLSAENVGYIRTTAESFKQKIANNEAEDFEIKALEIAEYALDQLSPTSVRRSRKNDSEEVYCVKIPLTISLGCTPFTAGLKKDTPDEFELVNSMLSRIKSAEERAKIDGRNTVRGFDGEFYFGLDEKQLIKLH